MHTVLDGPDFPAVEIVLDVDLEATVDEVVELFGGARAVALTVAGHPHDPALGQLVRATAAGQGHLADHLLDVDVHLVGLVDEDDAAVVLAQALAFEGAPPEGLGEHGLSARRLAGDVDVLGHQIPHSVGRGEQRAVHDHDAHGLAQRGGDGRHALGNHGGLAAPGAGAQVDALARLVEGKREAGEGGQFHVVVTSQGMLVWWLKG